MAQGREGFLGVVWWVAIVDGDVHYSELRA